MNRAEGGDSCTYRPDNPPPAEPHAQSDRCCRGQYYPEWNVELVAPTVNHQAQGDDTYGHLPVVLAMRIGHEGSGEDLHFTKNGVHPIWGAASK